MTGEDQAILDRIVNRLPTGLEFTEALSARDTAGRISAVIATYNRCPFDPAIHPIGDNPLAWSLSSLLAQEGHALAEIVIVDDASTDHTPTVVSQFANRSGKVPVRVIRLDRHAGTGIARTTGFTAARHRWVLLTDDDCVVTPHYAAGAAYLMRAICARDRSAAGVMLPFYYRATRPRAVFPAERIGRLDTSRAEFATGFHTWPADYVPRPPVLDDRTGLVAPMPVKLIGGTAVLDRDVVLATGGFQDLSVWASSYSDHLHLSADLTDAGHSLYHCPDPRVSAAHLKFGARGRFRVHDQDLNSVLPGLGRRFGDLIDVAQVPRADTGCRLPDAEFHAEMIGSFFTFFTGRNLAGGRRWAVRTWREFVLDGQVYSATVTTQPDMDERVRSWRDGLRRGARFLATGARPARAPDEVDAVLDRVSRDTGEVSIRRWRSR